MLQSLPLLNNRGIGFMENYVGKRLDGRYEIQEIIGVGGMSVVYKAYDNVDDRIVAVKILKDEFASDDDFVRRFKNESKAIAVLSHPNIVKVYDVSFGEKLQYIVMEYVDGITLKEYIQKQGTITWNDAVFFISQILKALQHAHDKGIVHRDIKPQNIILLPTGNIKVTDFGIARFSRTETRTLTENAIGSVHYISPEQAKGEFTDERADIYSLGVVFYELLAGVVPFEADSAVSVALKQVNEEPERLTRINPDIPLGIEQICMHAMQKNPLERYQTATEMLLDLEEVIKNPNATFDYTYYVDKQPTKYVFREEDNYKANEYSDNYEEFYEPEPNNKRRIIFATVIGLIFLAAAIVGIVIWLTQGVNADSVTLSNYLGQSYDMLISADNNDLVFIANYEQSPDHDPGTILAQVPEAGTKVIKGTTVNLTVAASEEDISVPNCYEMSLDVAKEQLAREGLTNVKIAEVSSETIEEGYVVYSEPKAFSIVSKDREITLYVSTGPSTTVIEKIKVPDVTGLSQSDAKAFLKKAGFNNVNVSTKDSTVQKGIVLSQSPTYGESIKADSSITIVVSTGYTTTAAPETYTITLSITLPNCFDAAKASNARDNLVITVNGEQYSKRQVTLDGSTVEIAIEGESGTDQKVVVSIEGIGASSNYDFKLNQNKNRSVDFSEYSDNNQE